MKPTSLNHLIVFALAAGLFGCGHTYPTTGTIERLDPRLDELIPPNAKIEKLASGFGWAEGPVWFSDGGYLVFSDVINNTDYKWKDGKGITVYLKPSGYTGATPRGGEPGSNGLTRDSAGRLVLCEHGDRRIARLEKDGTKTTLADRYEGKRFNSPNDLVYKSNGDLYFTDPPYGLEKRDEDPKKELPFCGVYRLSKDGKLTLLTADLTKPNGLAFSPDEKTLYVCVSDPDRAVIMAYEVKDDGTLANGGVFFDTTSLVKQKIGDKAKYPGLPDGIKVDVHGNLFATCPGGIFIITPGGKHLGTLSFGEPTANLAWAEDGSTLYCTSNHDLCRIRTSTKGKMP